MNQWFSLPADDTPRAARLLAAEVHPSCRLVPARCASARMFCREISPDEQ